MKLNNTDARKPKTRNRKISLGVQICPPSGELGTVKEPKHPTAGYTGELTLYMQFRVLLPIVFVILL